MPAQKWSELLQVKQEIHDEQYPALFVKFSGVS